jgi:hypothetical protein
MEVGIEKIIFEGILQEDRIEAILQDQLFSIGREFTTEDEYYGGHVNIARMLMEMWRG